MTDSPVRPDNPAVSPRWQGDQCDAYGSLSSDASTESRHHECPDFIAQAPVSKSKQDDDKVLDVSPAEEAGIPIGDNFSKPESEFDYPEEDCCDDQDQHDASDDGEVNSSVSDDPDQQYGSDDQGNNTSMSEGEDDSVASHDYRMSSNSSQPSFTQQSHVVGMEVPDALTDSNRTSCCSFGEAKSEDENMPSSSNTATLEPRFTTPIYTALSKPSTDLACSSPLPMDASSMRAPTQSSSDEAVDFRAAFKSNEISNPDCSGNFITSGSLTSSLLAAVNSQDSSESNQAILPSIFISSSTPSSPVTSPKVNAENSSASIKNNSFLNNRTDDELPKSEMSNSVSAPVSEHSSVTNTTVPEFESVAAISSPVSVPVFTARVRKLRSRSIIFSSCSSATSTKRKAKSKTNRRSCRSLDLHESLMNECNSLPGLLEPECDGQERTRCTSPAANSMPAFPLGSEMVDEREQSASLNNDSLMEDYNKPNDDTNLDENESGSFPLLCEKSKPATSCAVSVEGSVSGGNAMRGEGSNSDHALCSESEVRTDHNVPAVADEQNDSLSFSQEDANYKQCAIGKLTVDENLKPDRENIPDSENLSQEKMEADSLVDVNKPSGTSTDDLPALEGETNTTSQNKSQYRAVTSEHGVSEKNIEPGVCADKFSLGDVTVCEEGLKLRNKKRSNAAVLDDIDDLPEIDDVRPRKPNKGFKKMFEISSENIEELPDIEDTLHSTPRPNPQKRKREEECTDNVCSDALSELATASNLGISPEKPTREAVHQNTAVSSSSQSGIVSLSDRNHISVAGPSRDTAEELSARYYQNYLRYKRRIADYDRRLREQFTDSDTDDSTDHHKKEADRKRWIEKKNILRDKMNQLIELNGGPFNAGFPHERTQDDSCSLPSLYPASAACGADAAAARRDSRGRDTSNNGDSDNDIIVDDESSFHGRQKQSTGSWRRRPKLWLRKRKSEAADVVDLTNDVESDADDDDVEVLQHDKPVVYLKTESRRKRRRTARASESCSSAAAAQTIDLDNPEPAPPPQPIDFSDPNLLFGTLLEQPDRFILPKQTDEKQDPDGASDIKDPNGPGLLAAMGPLSFGRTSEGGNDGGAMWGETESSSTYTDTKAIVTPSTSDNNPSFSRSSPTGSNNNQYTEKAAAMEKIWQMLDVPDDDLVQCRSRQQASESAIPPALESAHLAAFGRSATPPSPYRTAPPPGCCPDYDSLHDTAVRQGSGETKSRSLPPGGPSEPASAGSSDANEEDLSQPTTSSGFSQLLGRKDVFRPTTRSRGMIDFSHEAQPQRINIGNSVRNILNPSRFGTTDGASSNPFNFGSRSSSSFLPIDRPGSSGRTSTAVSTTSSQDVLNSVGLNPVPCMRSTLRRHQHPTFQSNTANDLSVTSVFGNDPDTAVGPPAGRLDHPPMRRTPIGLDIPPAHGCSRVTRSTSLASEALPFPYIRTHFVGFPSSSSFSDAISVATVAPIPLPPSVPTQTSNSNSFAFVGSSRNDVPLNLEQRNTGPGRPGTSRGIATISAADSGSGTSGSILNAGNNSNNPTSSSGRTTRSSNSLMYVERNSDVHFVGANVTVMVDDDDDDDAEAEDVSGDADSSPNPQEQNVPENKPSSSTSAPSTSSAGKDDIDISCPICFDSLADIKERRGHLVSTICGHLFCEGCLDAAVRRHKQCPKCRKKLTKRQYHKLYL